MRFDDPFSRHPLHLTVLDWNVLDDPWRQCRGVRGLRNRSNRRGQPMAPNNSTTDPSSPSLPSHSAFLVLQQVPQGAEPTVPLETVLVATQCVVPVVQTGYDYPNRHWQKSRSSGILPVVVADSEGTAVVVVVVVYADFLLQMMFQGAGRTLRIVDVALKRVRERGCSAGIEVVVAGDSGFPGVVDWFLVDRVREVGVVEEAIDPLVVGDHLVGRLVDGTLPFAASDVDAAATSAVAEGSVEVLPDGILVETLPEEVLPVVAFPDTVVPGTSVPVVVPVPVVAASFAAVEPVVAATPAFVAVAEPVPVAAAPTVPPVPPPPSASSSASSSFSVAPRLPHPAEESVAVVVGPSDGTVDLPVLGVQGTMVSSE